jgi:hypothetical protein
MFLTLAQPTLGAYFHGKQKLCGKLAIGGYAHFDDYFLRLDGSGDGFVPMTSALQGPNKIVVMPI